ncbi:MAG: hypothetical protein V1837_05750 [Candidatus Woesearchaeota archaeon]
METRLNILLQTKKELEDFRRFLATPTKDAARTIEELELELEELKKRFANLRDSYPRDGELFRIIQYYIDKLTNVRLDPNQGFQVQAYEEIVKKDFWQIESELIPKLQKNDLEERVSAVYKLFIEGCRQSKLYLHRCEYIGETIADRRSFHLFNISTFEDTTLSTQIMMSEDGKDFLVIGFSDYYIYKRKLSEQEKATMTRRKFFWTSFAALTGASLYLHEMYVKDYLQGTATVIEMGVALGREGLEAINLLARKHRLERELDELQTKQTEALQGQIGYEIEEIRQLLRQGPGVRARLGITADKWTQISSPLFRKSPVGKIPSTPGLSIGHKINKFLFGLSQKAQGRHQADDKIYAENFVKITTVEDGLLKGIKYTKEELANLFEKVNKTNNLTVAEKQKLLSMMASWELFLKEYKNVSDLDRLNTSRLKSQDPALLHVQKEIEEIERNLRSNPQYMVALERYNNRDRLLSRMSPWLGRGASLYVSYRAAKWVTSGAMVTRRGFLGIQKISNLFKKNGR